ncbi:hypothetical protein VTK26DRAFT_4987 [Humicola hyalothermophila]
MNPERCQDIQRGPLTDRPRLLLSSATTASAMGKPSVPVPQRRPLRGLRREGIISGIIISGLALLIAFPQLRPWSGFYASSGLAGQQLVDQEGQEPGTSPYGRYPVAGDPFRFIPCTSATLPPPLDDSAPEQTWAARFDPNPDHWSWGPSKRKENGTVSDDPYAERSIYLCGYLDVPLDYTNETDKRIARLAVTKLQVSGLARVRDPDYLSGSRKSERTIVIEPGGPGGSGTSYVWRAAQDITDRFSNGTFDVLGWDPRGVNASLPSVACFPYDASRDHWSLLTSLHYVVSGSPKDQLELADAMNAAVMRACWERHGDLGRFVGTGLVARDLEQIRIALGEDELTGYLVSYGTGIGQTYAAMFPDSVGRLILDGTEYVRDHRLRGGFGWTALDNATDAWRDGFLGECVNAGPEHCALARSRDGKPVSLPDLETRMGALMGSLAARPIPGYLPSSGPTMVTYSAVVDAIYGAMYNARTWPTLAQALYELEAGNSTLIASMLESSSWYYDPALPCSPAPPALALSVELGSLVICADSYDASDPDDLHWWLSLWGNMTSKNWIAGNSRLYGVLPCRHFLTYWPNPVGVYRGDLNHTLKHPVLLIAETYDPATPLRNGRRLLQEMGGNARLIVHHGYGHSSRDTSSCTDSLATAYMLHGTLPEEPETDCYADEKPYLYGIQHDARTALAKTEDPLKVWKEHTAELSFLNPRLLRGR